MMQAVGDWVGELVGATGLDPLTFAAIGVVGLGLVIAGQSRNRSGIVAALGPLSGGLPYVVAGATIFGGAVAFGGVFGLSNLQLLAAVGLLTALLYVVVTSEQPLSFPFWLTFVPLLFVVAQYLIPDGIVSLFFPVLRAVGIEPQPLDSIQTLLLGAAGTVAYWGVSYRASSGSNRADTITKKIFGSGRAGGKGELTKLTDQYLTMGRILIGFALAVVALALSQLGEISAVVTSFIGDAPLVASNFLTAVVGFFALGGSLPGWLAWIPGLAGLVDALGGIGPTAFLLITVVALALAYGLREEGL